MFRWITNVSWYRYHHLFGNLLRPAAGAETTQQMKSTELHIRASEWFENNGLMLEAFRHAAAAMMLNALSA